MSTTTEQIVTNILSSNEILMRKEENLCFASPVDLGSYLKSLPPEEIVQETLVEKSTKYTFIKDGIWKF